VPPSAYAYAVIAVIILVLAIRYKETLKAAVMGKVATEALKKNEKINENNLQLEAQYEKDKSKMGPRPPDTDKL